MDRILDGLRGFWDATLEFLKNLVQDFKEANRYLKLKLFIIVGYFGISFFTVAVFLPSGELNQIDAEVRISKTEIVGGRYFLVSNEGSDDWKDVVLTLNGSFVHRYPALGAGKKKAFFFRDFMDGSGRRFSDETAADKLRIECGEGAFERLFQGGR